MTAPGMKYLLFDADDTLWENNIYYEEVRDRFLQLTDALGVARAEVLQTIDQFEHLHIRQYGYGSKHFLRSLNETYQHFARSVNHRDGAKNLGQTLAYIHDFGSKTLNYEIQFLPGVPDTLAALHQRYPLYLITKGDRQEQQAKIDRAKIGHFFRHIHIVAEKTPRVYEQFVEAHQLPRAHTWMIGNSPRSDVNPALEAGLNVVYIPHARTWHFEASIIPHAHEKLVAIERFSDLLNLF